MRRLTGARALGTAVVLTGAAAVLWGLFPVFVSLGAQAAVSGGALFVVVLNLAGAAVCAPVLFRGGCRREVGHLLAGPRGGLMLLANAACIALSNGLAFYALAGERPIAAALVIETWPLLAALVLPVLVPGYVRWTRARLPAIGFALAGLIALKGEGLLSGTFVLEASLALAVGSALAQVGTVVMHQMMVGRRGSGVGGDVVIGLQAVRMLAAGVCALPWFAADAALSGGAGFATGAVIVALSAGCAVAVSAVLATVALERSRAPVVSVIWVLAPVVTAVGMAGLGLDSLSLGAAVAVAGVVGALAWDFWISARHRVD